MVVTQVHGVAGADGGNMFKIRISSTVIVGIRRYGVDVAKSAGCPVWQILLLMEGPTEAPHMEHILAPTVDFFVKHDPGELRD